MKFTVLFALAFLAVSAHAFKQTENYVIFEKGDQEIKEYKNFLKRMGVNIVEVPRNEYSEQQYLELDNATKQLHETYLKLYNVTAEQFPLPYVIFEMTQYSANFTAVINNKPYATNFITLSVNHINNEDGMWSILAHEMAHYFHKHATKKTQFVRAGYTVHRDLTPENEYGVNFDHDPELAQK